MNKQLFHLQSLIEGAIYRELGETEMSIQVSISKHLFIKQQNSGDSHFKLPCLLL